MEGSNSDIMAKLGKVLFAYLEIFASEHETSDKPDPMEFFEQNKSQQHAQKQLNSTKKAKPHPLLKDNPALSGIETQKRPDICKDSLDYYYKLALAWSLRLTKQLKLTRE